MLSRRTEDYLEAIYQLSMEKGYTRIKDIASKLNVKPASVSEMVAKLAKEGYVVYEKRLFVALTEKGKTVAESVKERREILVKFLVTLGVPKHIAEEDACIIEHVLHPETVTQLKKFVKFVEESPIDPKWLNHFREFCRSGVHPCKVSLR
ncbi:metal-dependent transcriptional regulator [Archaeoglobus veneficus]|uniref:Iron (Metal) dependent repressor, DtxR family n=1 Tax=Archaeoglobus veneficus (strain DSM 11195 / SNP6) TaxID=693661 RepID=F2KN71_ARCVS|nr:metal-dependent transcriptional regulator [Archaeoglobus veneficus]AEA46172.1 iron (metal) dependent repressor, DtxR family [Archaeoglobus veneficus SNP6]